MEKVWGGEKVTYSLDQLRYLKIKWFLAGLKISSGKLVDLGCGGGGLTAVLAEYLPGVEVIGIENNPAAFRVAQKRFSEVDFIKANIERLPLKDQSVEIVTAFDVLEHVKNPKAVLKEAFRVLEKGGFLHLAVPLEGQPLTLYWVLKFFGWRGKEKYAGHIRQFSDQSLIQLVEKVGFQVIDQKYSFHFGSQLLDVLFYCFFARKMTRGLEEEIENQKWFLRLPINCLKSLLISLANLESLIFKNVVGGCCHLTAKKL
jgi:ubiquinone/menaquinone biosynthesis C-methylase UbiE